MEVEFNRSKLTEGVKVYLGDGVYAVYDGFNVMLYTEGNFEESEIFLEPNVVEALLKYLNGDI